MLKIIAGGAIAALIMLAARIVASAGVGKQIANRGSDRRQSPATEFSDQRRRRYARRYYRPRYYRPYAYSPGDRIIDPITGPTAITALRTTAGRASISVLASKRHNSSSKQNRRVT